MFSKGFWIVADVLLFASGALLAALTVLAAWGVLIEVGSWLWRRLRGLHIARSIMALWLSLRISWTARRATQQQPTLSEIEPVDSSE